jgi:hypothetical protein
MFPPTTPHVHPAFPRDELRVWAKHWQREAEKHFITGAKAAGNAASRTADSFLIALQDKGYGLKAKPTVVLAPGTRRA